MKKLAKGKKLKPKKSSEPIRTLSMVHGIILTPDELDELEQRRGF